MPAPPFTEMSRLILRAPAPAVLATLREDGSPVTVATWFLLEGDDRILINMDHTRARLEHIRRDPRVSITVLAEDDWYTHVSRQWLRRCSGLTRVTELPTGSGRRGGRRRGDAVAARRRRG